MRINVYAEELPSLGDTGAPVVERVETTAKTGITFFGARLYLCSSEWLHQTGDDDDRSAVTFWGPREKVAGLLRAMADAMNSEPVRDEREETK